MVVKKDLCIRCGACVRACPVNAISEDFDGSPYVCIHCGRCVASCPHDCLEMAEVEELRAGTKEVPS